jgi:hypothetical protein
MRSTALSRLTGSSQSSFHGCRDGGGYSSDEKETAKELSSAARIHTEVIRPHGYSFACRAPFGRDLDIRAPVNRPARPDPT